MAPEDCFTGCELICAREIEAEVGARDRLRRIQARSLLAEQDTPEARIARAEAVTAAALNRMHVLESEMRAVDDALRAERVPHFRDGNSLVRMTRMGRIRWLGDQRRVAERRFAEELFVAGRTTNNHLRRAHGLRPPAGQIDAPTPTVASDGLSGPQPVRPSPMEWSP